jgi:hypothetical protein
VRPYAITTFGQYLYYGGNYTTIWRLDLDFSNEVEWSSSLGSTIAALTVDNLGYLYCLTDNSIVSKIDISNNSIDLSFNATNGQIAWFDNSLFISNSAYYNISRYNSNTGNLMKLKYINNDASYNNVSIAFYNNFLYFLNPYLNTNSLANTIYKGVTASCYNFDTKILCLNHLFEEEYIPIQNLKSGDLVKTYLHGYQRIDLIGKISFTNNPSQWNQCMYKMEKTEENGLLEDLIVTGGHSILLDEFTESEKEKLNIFGVKEYAYKIDDKYLLLVSASDKFIKLTGSDIYTCYHFVLETNGNDDKQFGIWANGILTETTSKNYFKTQNYTLL